MNARFNGLALTLISLCLLLSFPLTTLADVVIIANKSITVDSVTAAEAKKIFLGKKKSISGGGTIKLADLPIGNATRKKFYRSIVNKKEKQLKAYWAKITFTGKGYPPRIFDSDTEVMNWVAETTGAIGYVSGASVNNSVNILLTK